MTILVIGGGGREHAVCVALRKSPRCSRLLCAPGNGGIASLATCFPDVKATDIDAVIALVRRERVDYVVVTPDDPLAIGMVDALEAVGVKSFGPRKNAAALEASKTFSKALMKKYSIPTARHETFSNRDSAANYIAAHGAPIVIKADGLALGKGVAVAQTVPEALAFLDELMLDAKFGASGSSVVIEECLTGPEVTVLALCDGKTLKTLPSSQDHKRVNDNDEGPNTGGMGAIAPCPLLTAELLSRCEKEIFAPTLNALNAEGIEFKGVIYFGLMLTPNGPKVIEYNARFGDPEAQVVLPLITSDLLEAMLACSNGTLDKYELTVSNQSACCVVMASGGYPRTYQTGYVIDGLTAAADTGAVIYHAGTILDGGIYKTSGGRVLGVTALADTLPDAVNASYAAVNKISFTDAHFRKDIGVKCLNL
ncbi:MAG: phosphoribosylamine--glycine ligase [Oscillospiraceae bacterium]|jgi:phosphoribosylamine--glycine ligase|nr:phosphoribosylamine--glycine ligase [Oscillospiraceae bacterium]